MMLRLSDLVAEGRHNRKVLLFIVYVALFLDNMLLTTVVPIMPEYLFRLEHPNATGFAWSSRSSMKSTKSPSKGPVAPPPLSQPMSTPYPARKGRALMLKTITTTMAYSEEDQWDGGVDYEMLAGDDEPTTTTTTLASTRRSRSRKNVSMRIASTGGAGGGAPTVEPPVAPKEETPSISEENIWVGIMFGSKALIQLLTNPFVGPLTNRIGYSIPMFSGFVIMFLSTLVFAFGQSYGVLFFARALQGIGSACTSSSGMGMLAEAYPDDSERGAAMGIALGGLALGVLIGPPFGGVLFEYSGKELPFIILALLALFDGGLQLLVLQPKLAHGKDEATSLKTLIKDPYIDVAAGAITIGNLGIAMLEPSLPLWMMDTMQATSATRGAAFLPASISYMIGTNIFGPLAYRIGRWLSALLGLIIIGACLIAIPSATSVYGLIAPNGFMGFAIGMIDASMFPQMGHLVDLRHVGVYGSIYAIADAAFCFAFALGPFFAGPIVRNLGFPAMLYIIGAVNFAYAPFLLLLRNPPARASEKEQLIPNGESAQFRYEKFEDTALENDGPNSQNYGVNTNDHEYGY